MLSAIVSPHRVLSSCHDEASRFIHVLSRGTRSHILPEDFLGLIQDVVDSHPGLAFLKDAAEFHSRYVHTVSKVFCKPLSYAQWFVIGKV